MVRKLLRYNSRHHLYHHPDYKSRGGARTVLGWSLNPIGSMHDGRQTSLHEPLWLFRLRQRLFANGGAQRCPERGSSRAFGGSAELPDTWRVGPDGNRTCSYCGSIHFEDLMKVCRQTLTDERYSVDGSDKTYKVYVRIPGVRNASEGAIKFYKHHSPESPSELDEALFRRAARVSRERFETRHRNRLGERRD